MRTDPKLEKLRAIMAEKCDAYATASRLDRLERAVNLMLTDEPDPVPVGTDTGTNMAPTGTVPEPVKDPQ